MNNQLAIIVITHERPLLLRNCLDSLDKIKKNDKENLIKVICIDNSTISHLENYRLFKQFHFQYIQQPGATQINNFRKALELASSYSFFALIHDDDLLLQANNSFNEITKLNNNNIYHFGGIIFNSHNQTIKKHKVSSKINIYKRCLSNYFPHKMPLFPTYIYPNKAVRFCDKFLADMKNYEKFGKYMDTAMIATLINQYSINIQRFYCIQYLYVEHECQDSSYLSANHKINLFLYLKNIFNPNLIDYLNSALQIIVDITKKILLTFFHKLTKI